MTDRSRSTFARSSSHVSSSSRAPASDAPSASSSVRPRNRRLISTGDTQDDAPSNRSSGLLSSFSSATSRAASPLPSSSRSAGVSPNRNATTGDVGQFLSESFMQGWSSVQGITSTFFNNVGGNRQIAPSPKQGPRGRRLSPSDGRTGSASWGPAPPTQKPSVTDVASGSLAKRQADLRAAKTASVLESHDGVNGGLDVSGKHKRRNSDEVVSDRNPEEDYLVYIHHVQPSDTYAGIILRYQCREDIFRKANGLWSRDSIQTRKWVTIPVDACDVRGRACDAPSWHSSQVDLLAPTPSADEASSKKQDGHDDFFNRPEKNKDASAEGAQAEDEKPWSHVRWVKIDSIMEPVEIGRVGRGAMGYFPPRRRRSFKTLSTLSTPRESVELPNNGPGPTDGPSPRRPSSLSSRPQFSGTPTSNRSRMGSDGAEAKPTWMNRPGGVGSMGKNARAPGPDRDVFNSWTRKHIPGLNIEGMPSMSIMGSETAHFGFKTDTGIVESSYEDGRDVIAPNRQGTGIDRAAAAVETWLRGALAKRPGTPLRGNRGGPDRGGPGDSIELTDTGSDDGRPFGDISTNLLDQSLRGSSGLSNGIGTVRGRAASGGQKGGKAD